MVQKLEKQLLCWIRCISLSLHELADTCLDSEEAVDWYIDRFSLHAPDEDTEARRQAVLDHLRDTISTPRT